MIADAHLRMTLGILVYQLVQHLEHGRALSGIGGRIARGDKGDAYC